MVRFRPILAGATLRDRLLSCAGALSALCATAALGYLVVGPTAALPFLVAPVGASAVLVFAVPASPLAQPWPVVGGNVLSTLVGLGVRMLVHDPLVASGLAVGAAIAAMSLFRCLHPPGGAAALTTVLSAGATTGGALFAFVPVGLNSVVLVALGWVFHRLSRHSYPHRPPRRSRFRTEDVDRALAAVGESYDISREDLGVLLREVETQALARDHGAPTAGDVMSRKVVHVGMHDSPDRARGLLLDHDVRLLPVLDPAGTVVGTVGLRELVHPARTVGEIASPPRTAPADMPAVALSRTLTDGRAHAVVIVDSGRRLLGIVSQTDLMIALTRALTD